MSPRVSETRLHCHFCHYGYFHLVTCLGVSRVQGTIFQGSYRMAYTRGRRLRQDPVYHTHPGTQLRRRRGEGSPLPGTVLMFWQHLHQSAW